MRLSGIVLVVTVVSAIVLFGVDSFFSFIGRLLICRLDGLIASRSGAGSQPVRSRQRAA